MSRSRLRVGRMVAYNPTAAEVTSNGEGPWPALIVEVFASGNADLKAFPPDASALGAAVADPITTSPNAEATVVVDATDLPSAEALVNDIKAKYNVAVTLINELKVDANAMATRLNQLVTGTGGAYKNNIQQGTTGGTFTLIGI